MKNIAEQESLGKVNRLASYVVPQPLPALLPRPVCLPQID